MTETRNIRPSLPREEEEELQQLTTIALEPSVQDLVDLMTLLSYSKFPIIVKSPIKCLMDIHQSVHLILQYSDLPLPTRSDSLQPIIQRLSDILMRSIGTNIGTVPVRPLLSIPSLSIVRLLITMLVMLWIFMMIMILLPGGSIDP